jgi:hypothetical protein
MGIQIRNSNVEISDPVSQGARSEIRSTNVPNHALAFRAGAGGGAEWFDASVSVIGILAVWICLGFRVSDLGFVWPLPAGA